MDYYRDMKTHHKRKIRPNAPSGLCCRGRIWIEKDGETFLGTGRIVLLSKIKEMGSISKAAKSMQMSYKRAWDLVDAVNRHAGQPLVITSKGGKGGGGAALTKRGEEIVREFNELLGQFHQFLDEKTITLP